LPNSSQKLKTSVFSLTDHINDMKQYKWDDFMLKFNRMKKLNKLKDLNENT